MDELLVELLVCPLCGGDLRWSVSSRRAGRIEEGEATCSSCGASYPVREGIGLFLTPDLPRNDLWEGAESGLARHLREHPDMEERLLRSPLSTLNPADRFFRSYVLEERGDWAGAAEALDA